jgi:hypothetical protein
MDGFAIVMDDSFDLAAKDGRMPDLNDWIEDPISRR